MMYHRCGTACICYGQQNNTDANGRRNSFALLIPRTGLTENGDTKTFGVDQIQIVSNIHYSNKEKKFVRVVSGLTIYKQLHLIVHCQYNNKCLSIASRAASSCMFCCCLCLLVNYTAESNKAGAWRMAAHEEYRISNQFPSNVVQPRCTRIQI